MFSDYASRVSVTTVSRFLVMCIYAWKLISIFYSQSPSNVLICFSGFPSASEDSQCREEGGWKAAVCRGRSHQKRGFRTVDWLWHDPSFNKLSQHTLYWSKLFSAFNLLTLFVSTKKYPDMRIVRRLCKPNLLKTNRSWRISRLTPSLLKACILGCRKYR